MPEIDISDEQCVFCPHCRGENVDLERETTGSFLVVADVWKCQDCGKEFTVERRTHLVWQEADA